MMHKTKGPLLSHGPVDASLAGGFLDPGDPARAGQMGAAGSPTGCKEPQCRADLVAQARGACNLKLRAMPGPQQPPRGAPASISWKGRPVGLHPSPAWYSLSRCRAAVGVSQRMNDLLLWMAQCLHPQALSPSKINRLLGADLAMMVVLETDNYPLL